MVDQVRHPCVLRRYHLTTVIFVEAICHRLIVQLHGLTCLELRFLGTLAEEVLEGTSDVCLAHHLRLVRVLLHSVLLALYRLSLSLAS